MTVINQNQFHYPEDMEHATEHEKATFGRAHRLYGTTRLTGLFGGAAVTPAPWPMVGKTKSGFPYDRERVAEALRQPPQLEDIDPRNLHATQPSVVRTHAAFYMGEEYEQTGQTSADVNNVGNRYPMVYRDARGRNLLLAGHHRATAALLRGRPLRARLIAED